METSTLGIQVNCADLDDEGLHDLAGNLRKDLSSIDVDTLRFGTTDVSPAGAKSGEVLAVGALVVSLAPAVVEGLVVVITSWLSRQPRDVDVEIDGQRFRGRVTKSQRDELVAALLRRLDDTE